MGEHDASGGGVSALGALWVLFIGLKLTDNLDWSWWWVNAPVWAPLSLLLVMWAVLEVLTGRR